MKQGLGVPAMEADGPHGPIGCTQPLSAARSGLRLNQALKYQPVFAKTQRLIASVFVEIKTAILHSWDKIDSF